MTQLEFTQLRLYSNPRTRELLLKQWTA